MLRKLALCLACLACLGLAVCARKYLTTPSGAGVDQGSITCNTAASAGYALVEGYPAKVRVGPFGKVGADGKWEPNTGLAETLTVFLSSNGDPMVQRVSTKKPIVHDRGGFYIVPLAYGHMDDVGTLEIIVFWEGPPVRKMCSVMSLVSWEAQFCQLALVDHAAATADVVDVGGIPVSTMGSGIINVNLTHVNGTAVSDTVAGKLEVDIFAVGGGTGAAANLEDAFDGSTTYAFTGWTIPNVTTTATATAIASGGITNASFATDVGTTVYASNRIAQAADKGVTNYDPPTKGEMDSLEAHGDGYWITGPTAGAIADSVWDEAIAGHIGGTTFGGKNQKVVPSETLADYKASVAGLSTHSAADVWSVGARTITGTGVGAFTSLTFAAGSITGTAMASGVIGADELTTSAVEKIRTEMDNNSSDLNDILTDTGTTLNTHLTDIKGGTWNGSTDALDAIRARGDGYWTTGSGTSTLTAAQVNTEVDTALTDINLDHLAFTATGIPAIPAGTWIDTIIDDTNELQTDDVPGLIAALNDVSTAQVNTEVDNAIVTYHLDHLLYTDYDPASKPGSATALLNELVENDGGVSRYTTNALEQARGTNSAYTGTPPTVAQIRTEMDNNSVDLNDILTDTGTTIPATLTTIDNYIDSEVGDILTDTGTTLNTHLTDIKGGTWNGSTDALDAIRARGDAAWITGGGASSQLLSTTVATVDSQTQVTLTAGSDQDNAYNGAIVILTDTSNSTYPSIRTATDYVGATKTLVIDAAPGFTSDMVATDGVNIFVAERVLDQASAVDGYTVRQALRYFGAVLAGETSGAGTGTEVFKGLDGLTDRLGVTIGVNGNRTNIDYDP